MTKRLNAALLLFGVWLFTATAGAQTVSGPVTLDDGVTTIVVTSTALSWPVQELATLAIQADRSTKDDCMFVRPTKGMFEPGDRVFISQKYLAWLGRGTLRGLWTLNPATRTFRYLRLGPESCSWAHNELLTGSANPQGEAYFWDQHAPPVEHTMQWQITVEGVTYTVGTGHEVGWRNQIGSGWSTIYDGVVIPEGVIYATGSKLTATDESGYFTVDISDATNSNGIQNWVDSQVGYIMRPDDIRVIWRYSPATATASPLNTYYWLWLNYSFDNDGTTCDSSAANDWPSMPWGEPRYFESNRPSVDVTGGALQPANTVVGPLPRGTPCSKGNPGRYTSGAPAHGDWVRFGDDSSLQAGTKRISLQHVVDSGWGTPVTWDFFGPANEDWDGVWGIGGQRFAFKSPIQWVAGVWYTTSYVISLQ